MTISRHPLLIGTGGFASLFKCGGSAQVRHLYIEKDQAPAPSRPDIIASFHTLCTLRV